MMRQLASELAQRQGQSVAEAVRSALLQAKEKLEHDRAARDAQARAVIDELRARRNRSGGYWIAKDDPQAATQAVTGSVPLGQLIGAALLSNGASRVVDPYRLAEWPAVLELMRTMGPNEIIRRVREVETLTQATGSVPDSRLPDDATVAYCEPGRT